MFRLLLLPLLFLTSTLVVVVFGYYLLKKIISWVKLGYKKGADLVAQRQRNRTQKEQLQKLPEIVQKGFDDYRHLEASLTELPKEWKTVLTPVVELAQQILDEVILELSKNNSGFNNELNRIRPFFNHSLDALSQFSQKLAKDHRHMNNDLIDKAHQNITLFKADLLRHQETLHKGKQQDFDILMDVTKERLKK